MTQTKAPATDTRIVELLEILVKQQQQGNTHTETQSNETKRQRRLISLAVIWAAIGLSALYIAMVELHAHIADTRLGGLLGIESQESSIAGGEYASPIVGKSLEELANYQPSHGQSFGPETGNKRSYGPHGGIDFDCRVGGCAGADVAAPISGKVSAIEKIATSINGPAYRLKIKGEDWKGAVEHRLVHVDSITVKVGDEVRAGQVVAKVSPRDSVSTGPHLDWKIQRNGQWENPQKWAKEAIKRGGKGGFVSRYVSAISNKESGDDYGAVNADSGALGKYQFMPATMKSTALNCPAVGFSPTSQEFLARPDLQDKIMNCFVEGKLATIQGKTADPVTQCRMMAAIHYSGDPDLWDNTNPQAYGGNSYPSIASYTSDICKGF